MGFKCTEQGDDLKGHFPQNKRIFCWFPQAVWSHAIYFVFWVSAAPPFTVELIEISTVVLTGLSNFIWKTPHPLTFKRDKSKMLRLDKSKRLKLLKIAKTKKKNNNSKTNKPEFKVS